MIVAGVQKLTLLDYPSHVACTIFLQGCNFNCPFCHNSSLIPVNSKSEFEIEEFFKFLSHRVGILEGVAITGGEPLLNKDINIFIKRIKDLGFLVKLDTNGSNPEMLKKLIDEKLVDYVAMDIKNTFSKYELTTGCKVNLDNIKKSIDVLINSSIDYEFRTTTVKEYHDPSDFIEIGSMIKGAKKFFIQSYKESEFVINKELHPLDVDSLKKCLENVKNFVLDASLRGIE